MKAALRDCKPIRGAGTVPLLLFLIPVLVFSLTLHALAQPQKDIHRLLFTGMFHGDEVTARDNEAWLALAPSGSDFRLMTTRIRVESVYDAIVDGEGEKTGKQVSSTDAKAPLFLVKGISGLTEGRVETVVAQWHGLTMNKPIYLHLSNNKTYELLIWCNGSSSAPAGRNSRDFKECPLTLRHETYSQDLALFFVYHPPGGQQVFAGEATPALMWAGDVNRDGRLDLLIDTSNHYNTSHPALFLSSSVRGRPLVFKTAEFVLSGC